MPCAIDLALSSGTELPEFTDEGPWLQSVHKWIYVQQSGLLPSPAADYLLFSCLHRTAPLSVLL